LAEKILKEVPEIDLVVSPALGGIVVGQEVAAQIGCRAIFCERVDGKLALRRGFTVEKGEKCLVVEESSPPAFDKGSYRYHHASRRGHSCGRIAG